MGWLLFGNHTLTSVLQHRYSNLKLTINQIVHICFHYLSTTDDSYQADTSENIYSQDISAKRLDI